MKPYWTVCNEDGETVVENIYDPLTAEATAKKLVNEFERPFTVREYGLKSVSVFKPTGAAK